MAVSVERVLELTIQFEVISHNRVIRSDSDVVQSCTNPDLHPLCRMFDTNLIQYSKKATACFKFCVRKFYLVSNVGQKYG